MTTKDSEFVEIRFVMANGLEIVVPAAYVQKLVINHEFGWDQMVRIDLQMIAPHAVWTYRSESDPPAPQEIEPPFLE